jgi:hypothetical protein
VGIMATFVFRGSSGKEYTYSLMPLEAGIPIPKEPGNYILAAGDLSDPKPMLIEFTELLQGAADSETWKVATDIFGVTLLYVHIDPTSDARSRLAEKRDLVDSYLPPMNRG